MNMLHLILSKVKQSLSPLACLLAAIFLSITLLAQQPIRGKVSDAATGAALARATIITKPGKTATLSTDDGSFTINLDASAKNIVVSYTGYETRTIAINPGTAYYSIVLQPVQRETVVTVIGSRNPSRTNVQSPVPVDIIPVAAMAKQLAQTDVQQLLSYTAPSFQSARQAVADGTDHIDPAQLRGLGSDQLLVLINGKRRHQAALVNVNGTVNRGQAGTDLGAIPVEAIERIEVLRDGAAAQYGSDAIAGVINIVLKKTVQQLSGNISAGENSTRYNKDYALSKLGMTGAGNKHVQDGGNFLAGLNYGFSLNHNGFINLTGNYSLRDKTNRSGTYTGPLYANINGANRDDSILAARGLSRNNFDMRIGNSRMSSAAFMLNAAYALSRQWQLQLVAGYSSKQGEAAGFFRYPSSVTSGAGIYADKVFTLYPNGFLPLIKSHIKDISFSAGINGALGKWKASLSNTFGVNHFDFNIANSVNYTQFATGNNVPTKFDAGGLQFLQNTINLDFTRHFTILQGLHIAQGAEFRVDQYSQRAGEEASYRNYNTASGAASGAQVFAGFVPDYARQHARHNIALYADLEQDLSSHWLIQAALRFENYSDFGSTL
ncbi:MAG TPA: TonB-dependent receptor plug domain-containing protein, partial [Chitinophagaceae bacterium]|nr:TonB-dependent receptor plug domain-containing protein [Chitinophagaceae bacterium]